jgi:serine/threonine-protein kinase
MTEKIIGQKYRIDREIGRGGMGVVYSGWQLSLDRPVAIKALSGFSNNPEYRLKLLNEARTTAQLAHPNIVQIYDVINENDTCYLIIELVKGITLKSIIDKKGPLPIGSIIEYSLDVASGLNHAHSAVPPIIHRDIKSANLMLDEKGKMKIMDFGIAIQTEHTECSSCSVLAGSAPYISPEQAEGKPTDARSDIYSFGVVMYEMLTGRIPFGGESAFAIIYGHMHEEPIPPSQFRADLCQEGEKVILTCMGKNPDDRYPDALSLKNALVRWRDGFKGSVLPSQKIGTIRNLLIQLKSSIGKSKS